MSYNYGNNGDILQDINEIANRFRSLGEALSDRIDPPPPSDYDFEQMMGNIKKCLEIKKKYNVEDIYFYETASSTIMCLTNAERKMAQNSPLMHHEITDPYRLEDAMASGMQHFKMMNTGCTHYGVDDLKRSWLTLTLSGLEE